VTDYRWADGQSDRLPAMATDLVSHRVAVTVAGGGSDGALEQQTATSEVLRVVSSSPGELEPVFEAMLANATRVCEAKFDVLYLFEGDAFRAVALHSAAPASFIEARRRQSLVPIIPGPRSGASTGVFSRPSQRALSMPSAQKLFSENFGAGVSAPAGNWLFRSNLFR
jgi:hypothetical protein